MSEKKTMSASMPAARPTPGSSVPFDRAWPGGGPALVLFALGACWWLFFNKLRDEWGVNPQYSYGYVVPLLGAALWWRRWPDRPPAVPGAARGGLAAVTAGLLLLQLPLTVIYEANPEWRLLYWVNGFQVLGLTGCLLYHWGGRPWIRHFGPALGFMLIAVPWPMEWEQGIIQGLMRFVAGLTVEVAGLLNIPALQHGNLIEVGTGTVGIDEACSGIRSLQSALMLSLFLGEMHRFSGLRRVILLVASLGFVILANLTRTSFLVWAAANRGLHQMEAWHDAAGTVIMVIVLPSLMGLAWLMKPRAPTADLPPAEPSRLISPVPRWVGLSVIGWLLVVQAATEGWYRAHETKLIPNQRWSIAWPVDNPQFTKTSIPELSLAILRCSDSEAGAWPDAAGNHWSAFLLRWNPGKNSEQLAKGHRPDICFPAAGARLMDDFGRVTVVANGITMTFRHQTFAAGASVIHVFHCLWADQLAPHEDPLRDDGSQASRLLAVLAGKRNLGQKVLELVVQGPDTNDEAVAALKQQLAALIRQP
jgi:exosortase